MDEILEQLILSLPNSPTTLSKSNIQKIHSYLPVPSNYKIIWADITSFGGYPCGLIITDKALITKASKKEVKNNNELIKKQNKIEKKKNASPKIQYRIIPWEYFSPEDYEIEKSDSESQEIEYFLKSRGIELAKFKGKAFFDAFNSYKDYVNKQQAMAEDALRNSTFSSINTVNTEGVLFNATYGKDTTKTGHGIYAEEAGSLIDKIYGEDSTVVGRDNAKNGPDKIVNSEAVQCKYCKTANQSIDACFRKDPTTGKKVFRYLDLNNEPMKIEVASDQYIDAINRMKNKIVNGEVPGVDDANKAYDIVRKGKITYTQAKNLAKAGTIESLTYDTVTGAINCVSVFGISAVVTFSTVLWSTHDINKAAKTALLTGIQVYGLTFLGGILASQLSRTAIPSAINPFISNFVQHVNPQIVQNVVNSFRTLAGKSPIYGASAQKSFVKFLNSTAITQCAMFIVFAIPDTYRVLFSKISLSQYFKNMSSLSTSFIASTVASISIGAKAGQVVGEKFGKKAGAAAGMAIGAVGGLTASCTTRAIGRLFKEDDFVIYSRLINAILINCCIEYMLSSEEMDVLLDILNDDEKNLKQLYEKLINSTSQEQDIISFITPKIQEVINKRNVVNNTDEEISDVMESIIMNGGLSYAM